MSTSVYNELVCVHVYVPLPASSFLLVFIAEQDIMWYGISCWSAVPTMFPPRLLPSPSLLALVGQLERHPWCYVSTAHQQPQHWCVSSTGLATNKEHNTTGAVIGNGNCTPGRPGIETLS